MSEETIQGEHRKLLFQKLRDICGCLTTEGDCDEIARVVFESYPNNEKMSKEIERLKDHLDTAKITLNGAISTIIDIRRAVGDPTGKLMHDELVAHCGEIYKRAESYNHLVESLPKSKRPFSDKQAQKVIASQVKRITQLEDDLSRANCELDKERKKNAWHGVNTESFIDGVRTGELDLRKGTK